MKKAASRIALILIIAMCVGLLSGCGALTKEYTVTFDLNGGELVSGELVQKVPKGESAAAPEVKNGRMILSWDGSWENVDSDRTITAQWAKQTFKVEFDLNGGELVSGELSQTVEDGDDAVPPEVKLGRKAVDWGTDWQNVDSDRTVKATWNKVEMDTSDLAKYVQERTVTVNVDTIGGGHSTGSGFIIDNEGTVVTNFHVIDMAEAITVEAGSGATYQVTEIVDFSNVYDLAVLKINMDDSPYLEIAEEPVATGEQVYAVGSALGELKGSFTAGIVSSNTRNYGLIDCIQMDAAISSGNSGGPLVNKYGEVVGINVASYTRGENLNLAIKPTTLDNLTMDKHWTVKDFNEWYELESSRSWSPHTETVSGSSLKVSYFYSLVRNYGTVTGAKCVSSVKFKANANGGGTSVTGYRDMYDYYIFEYTDAGYDQYVEYLKSIGFEFDRKETQSTWNGTSYYYYNEHDNITLDMFILHDRTRIQIYPYNYYY